MNRRDTAAISLIHQFFKGVFRTRPIIPKYQDNFDVDIVFNKIADWGPSQTQDLEKLTLKVDMLLALGSAFRAQTIALIKMNNVNSNLSAVEIRITDLINTSRSGADQPYAFFKFFNNENLCIAITLLFYLETTKEIRGIVDNLLIFFKKPHKNISAQTVSRWLKRVMSEVEIDNKYKSHSTSHAASSKAS